ncbi:MAG: hypothetical protein FJX65_06560 [Alphaproteobacteria bacterium]|nr:hypothetical protein [Alphaproteobacteria bacterium]
MSTFRFKSLGLVYAPKAGRPWARSHTQAPTPLSLGVGRFRVYGATRDEHQRSHIDWFDIDLTGEPTILTVAEEPALAPGPLGNFDGDGVYPASVVRDGDAIRLYTIGWNAGLRPPMFYAAAGLAISHDGGRSFKRARIAPILARSEHDPCLVTAPVVRREGERWRMWYVSGYRWEEGAGGLTSRYHIKYAESRDGIEWQRDGRVCIDTLGPDETNIARCWTTQEDGAYQGWYSFARRGRYQLGYATSADGLTWERRDDDLEFESSGEAWDRDVQAYPAVVRVGRRWFMFYNGAGFGRDGVGLAVAEP